MKEIGYEDLPNSSSHSFTLTFEDWKEKYANILQELDIDAMYLMMFGKPMSKKLKEIRKNENLSTE